MSTTIDKPHVLLIDDSCGEKDWRIVHPLTCPWDAFYYHGGLFEDEPRWHFHRVCLTQWEVDGNGLDGLSVHDDEHIDRAHVKDSPFEADWLGLRPGRYVVQATYSWSGSWYDETDSDFYVSGVAPVTRPT